MNLRQVKLVYCKELKDILRDRRTLRLMILVPVVLYPLMSIGISSLMMSMIKKQEGKAAPILVLGASSELRAALESSERKIELVPMDVFIATVEALDPEEYPARIHLDAWRADPYSGLSDSVQTRFYYACVKGRAADCILEIPPNLIGSAEDPDSLHARIFYDEQEFRSDAAESKVRAVLRDWRDTLSMTMLREAGMDDGAARRAFKPFWISNRDVAPAEKKTGFMLAMMLPYMIILMVMLGAMYPAIELTAGEKERGTLETILASPAGRTEITLGKFLCVFTAAIATVILGSFSMTFTSSLGMFQFGNEGSADVGTFNLAVNPSSLIVVVLLMLPTGALLSALLLSISVMARSFKEAQGYITPLMFLVIIPSMIAFMPGIELTAGLAWVPVANIALGVKAAMLTAKGEAFPWAVLGMVFLSTMIYASFALFLVRQMFNKESVLFRT